MSSITERVVGLIEAGEMSQLEDMWLEVIDEPPTDVEFYRAFIKMMRRAKAADTALVLLIMALEEIAKRGLLDLARGVVDAAAPVWPDSSELRKVAGKVIRAIHASDPNLSAMLSACKGLPLPEVLKKIDSFQAYQCGQVFHHAYWGEGIVRVFDLAGNRVVLDFPSEKGKAIALDFLAKHLRHLPHDSFLALRAKDPERLRDLGESDPGGLVRKLLAGAGGTIKQAEMKKLLLAGVVEETGWTTWWNRAREALRLDPLIDFDARRGAHSELVLRSTPKTPEEEAAELFEDPESTAAQRAVVLRRLGSVDVALLERIGSAIQREFAVTNCVGRRIELAYLARDFQNLGTTCAVPDVETMLADASLEDLSAIGVPDYAETALSVWCEGDSLRLSQAIAYLPQASSVFAQALWPKAVDSADQKPIVAAVERLMQSAVDNPETCLWVAKTLTSSDHLEGFFPMQVFVPEWIDLMNSWEKLVGSPGADSKLQAVAKQLITKGRAVLQARQYAPLREAVEHMTLDQALRLFRDIQASDALHDNFKAAAEKLIHSVRPDVRDSQTPTEAPSSSVPEFHFTTAAARESKLAELRELTTVTIPANAQEIENARQEGDLKENAGYIFAKEKQKMLMQRMMQLQNDIQTARVFEANAVREGAIGFGTGFDGEDKSTGAIETYTVLGRFEAEPERHIVSYQSPFMQPFIGAKVGDEVVVVHPGGGETHFTVRRIWNALAAME